VTLTADHLIEPVELFQKTILSAARKAAVEGSLYTLGIAPTYPATGYGYLERGRPITDDEGIKHFQLVQFKEKPDTETACRCIESGKFYWNSGIFVWTADAIWKEIELHLPNHAKVLAKAAEHDRTPQWNQVLKTAFESIEPISIDVGVMEKASDVCCVASNFSWSDVGGWLALEDHLAGDNAGNRCRGETVTLDAADNLVFCENPRETVVLIGIKDLIVVRSGSTTLISHKNRVEELKELVKNMAKK
jgi:mannose-1-phosphate guanylyltransferase